MVGGARGGGVAGGREQCFGPPSVAGSRAGAAAEWDGNTAPAGPVGARAGPRAELARPGARPRRVGGGERRQTHAPGRLPRAPEPPAGARAGE